MLDIRPINLAFLHIRIETMSQHDGDDIHAHILDIISGLIRISKLSFVNKS